ncbi:hypothetical protein CE91St35_15500 [Eggerthella lenta]|nr:hypothetical protein CE91St35_15500 [Eggerthella lenta]
MRIPIDKNIRDMLVEESQRMGGGNPTADELACVVERAFEISRRKNKDLQAEGIKRARQRDVVLGRPKKAKPKNWPDIYEKCVSGFLSQNDASKLLGISRTTLNKWLKEEKEKSRATEE